MPIQPFGMKNLTFAAAAFAVALASTSLPSMAAGTPMDTIHQAVMDFNNGHYAAWTAACTSSAVVTDDFPPYIWSGANACNNWLSSWRTFSIGQKISNVTVTFGAPIHMAVGGGMAYIVLPATLRFNQHGKPVRMGGNVMTIVMRKGTGGDWKMTGWAWADGKY